MGGNAIWLWPCVDPMFRALDASGFPVKTLVAHPQTSGSWYVDVNRGSRAYRIVVDGKDRIVWLQAGSAPGQWKDLRSFLPVDDGSWIDQTVKELERQPQ